MSEFDEKLLNRLKLVEREIERLRVWERPSSKPDGWTPVSGTFSYASASTINISAGGASVYAVGDRLKWITATGSTQRWGTVVAVADTLLTIAVNTDHVLVNEAWTLPYYSHQTSPVGFPDYFDYTATVSGTTGSIGTFTANTYRSRFSLRGKTCHAQVSIYVTNVGSWSGIAQVLRPIASKAGDLLIGSGFTMAVSTATPIGYLVNSGDIYFKFQAAFGAAWMNWGAGGLVVYNFILINDVYEVA